MTTDSKKRRIKWSDGVILLFILIFSAGVVYSGANLAMWVIDSKKVESEISSIEEKVNVKEVNDSKEVKVIESEEQPEESNPYWDYIKMKFIDVDFSELKSINPDVKGWIQVSGTSINYPFVQGNDNDYYLHHSFYKDDNYAGWVFLDYRNARVSGVFGDKNTIIYGHALAIGPMFGTLKDVLEPFWQDDTNNHVVRISTEEENTLWQVFSIYTLPNTSDYLQVKFDSDTDFLDFVRTMSDRSVYDFNVSVGKNDKILTLSSCYVNSNSRIVLHAKLIKRQQNGDYKK